MEGTPFACGENGEVYRADTPGGRRVLEQMGVDGGDAARMVIKQEPMGDDRERIAREQRYGADMAKIGVGPKIYASGELVCGGRPHAVTVMERLDRTWQDVYPHGDDGGGGYAIDRGHEEQLLRAVLAMLRAGVAHNDLHTGNIGFAGGRVVIFDWGFAAPLEGGCVRQALIAHLYQIIEHYSFETRDDSALYGAIYDLRQGKPLD